MRSNEHLRANFIAYSNALHQLAQLLEKAIQDETQPRLKFELAAQAYLNNILFRRIFQQVAPNLMNPEIIQQLEEVNVSQREICEILRSVEGELAGFRWEGGDLTRENLALIAAISPTQNSMGAYFTPPVLAAQICREAIANWIWTRLPEALRTQFFSDIQTTMAKQGYLTGYHVEEFFKQLPTWCRSTPEDLIQELILQVAKCRILDPACGSGIFLVEAAQIIFMVSAHLYSRLGRDVSNNDLAREICTKSLFGIDLVPEYVRVARVLIFTTLLPHLRKEDILPSFTGICQHIQVGNFLLSPYQEKLTSPVPPVLNSRILLELATCFLDVIANNPTKKPGDVSYLEQYARGPIEEISNSAWNRMLMYLGIAAKNLKSKDLSEIILKQLNPPLHVEDSYDIILGNPPQEGARKETGRQQPTSWTIRVQRVCIKYLQKSKIYADLQEAWDFSVPFIIRSMEVQAPDGTLAFILPRSIGTQTFARKVLTKVVHKIRRVVYFNPNASAVFENWNPAGQELVPAGNDFLMISCTNSTPVVPRFMVEELSPFNYLGIPSASETRQGEDVLRFMAQPPNMPKLRGIPLKFFVTITKGATLCAKAEWRRTRGSFKTRDLVSNARDANHPLRFVEPTHIGPFLVAGESFLEYHHAQYPERVPANIHRWREDSFFHGPLLVTPLSKRIPSFALIPADFEGGAWRSPETVVLFKRWVDWFREFPDKLPPAIERMKAEVITTLKDADLPASMFSSDNKTNLLEDLSGRIPLEVLALVLSSPVVHELRFKGGKSFGKFEAGDWENIPLPRFTETEVAALLDEYQAIYKTLMNLQKRFAQSGLSGKTYKVLVEKNLFSDPPPTISTQKEKGGSLDFQVIRERLERSAHIIEVAYRR